MLAFCRHLYLTFVEGIVVIVVGGDVAAETLASVGIIGVRGSAFQCWSSRVLFALGLVALGKSVSFKPSPP